MGNLTANFNRSEFACPCCGVTDINMGLVEALQRIRNDLGQPMTITSGYRCKSHNQAVGGVDTSAHVYGFAADMACDGSVMRALLLPLVLAEFKRVGIGAGFIHVDVDPTKPANVVWDYYGDH